ncbi:hypothetical protein ATO10_03430 [Actibacterium atlanticum]|uniref:YitT family protein n=1 Tax=Actibacterium atlanticum TaxID=1461693 RepID=A0A058ZRE4_9RHOB|nr:YitT family protein [Actibacterium atlanticum]KCV83780.1 hypothetical protein ATO10_03430 [Actibacterium atlanticum]
MLLSTPRPEKHSPLEDIQGLVVGTLLVAISVQFLHSADLITGQIAGLSLIGSYVSDWSFGAVFFVLNLPFYWLALRRIGWRFTLKTFAAVGLLSVFTELLPRLITIDALNPYAAGVLAGVSAGAGLLALFRHSASLGGVGIVALYLQDRFNFKAGWTQLIFDAGVFGLALILFSTEVVLPSLLGAVVLNIIIATNHRRDRYIAR